MAYFVPDDVAVNAFVAAMKRGVKVQLILPGDRIDVEIVRLASRAAGGEPSSCRWRISCRTMSRSTRSSPR